MKLNSLRHRFRQLSPAAAPGLDLKLQVDLRVNHEPLLRWDLARQWLDELLRHFKRGRPP